MELFEFLLSIEFHASTHFPGKIERMSHVSLLKQCLVDVRCYLTVGKEKERHSVIG